MDYTLTQMTAFLDAEMHRDREHASLLLGVTAVACPVHPGQMDRSLSLDETDYLRHRVLRRRLTSGSFYDGHP